MKKYILGLLGLVLILGLGAYSLVSINSVREETPHNLQRPIFEVYPDEVIPDEVVLLPPQIKPLGPKRAQIAIIIDDIGYDPAITVKLLQLKGPLTFSILPYAPYKTALSKKLKAAGAEIMLHLPMEPTQYPRVNPGYGALLTNMTQKQLMENLLQNLNAIKGIQGVNNHMGSKLTQFPALIYKIMAVIKERKLFFIDSLTSVNSKCKLTAGLLKIPFAQRDVFLDYQQSAEVVRKQLRVLVRLAYLHGQAIGIGHPHDVTYEVLKAQLPQLHQKVELVNASQLVHTSG